MSHANCNCKETNRPANGFECTRSDASVSNLFNQRYFSNPLPSFFSLFFVCVFFNITVNHLINMYSFPVLEEWIYKWTKEQTGRTNKRTNERTKNQINEITSNRSTERMETNESTNKQRKQTNKKWAIEGPDGRRTAWTKKQANWWNKQTEKGWYRRTKTNWMNPWMDGQTGELENQRKVKRRISQLVNHSVSPLVSQSVSQSVGQSVCQSVYQLVSQSVSQLIRPKDRQINVLHLFSIGMWNSNIF